MTCVDKSCMFSGVCGSPFSVPTASCKQSLTLFQGRPNHLRQGLITTHPQGCHLTGCTPPSDRIGDV